MYVPVNSENVKMLKTNFNIPHLLVNDDFIEVLDFKKIKIYFIFDGLKYFEPVIECKAFNSKNFILGLHFDDTTFTGVDDFYFLHFSKKYKIDILNDYDEDFLNQLIVKMYFEIIKCIKYEIGL